MPQGRSMAKDLSFMPLSAQARPAVEFHWSKFQHFVWLWIWSKRQCSGTRRASDWKGPSVIVSSVSTEREQGGRYWSALLVDEDDVRVCIVADIERLGGWTLNTEQRTQSQQTSLHCAVKSMEMELYWRMFSNECSAPLIPVLRYQT